MPKIQLHPDNMYLGPRTEEILGVEDISQIEICTPWHQGGSETYVTDFILNSNDNPPKHLIAKACIKMGARLAMAEWFKRRERLAENGITFPALYAKDEIGATWLEEFVPFTYEQAYTIANDEERAKLKEQFTETYLRIEGAGFAPKAMHDLRSHGTDVVVIDVGEDLGGWSENVQCDLRAYANAERFLRAEIPRG